MSCPQSHEGIEAPPNRGHEGEPIESDDEREEYCEGPHASPDREQRIAFVPQALDLPSALQLGHAGVNRCPRILLQDGAGDLAGARRPADGIEEKQDQAARVLQLTDGVFDFAHHRHLVLHQWNPAKSPQ
jgi:hypothetical protein